MKLRILLVLTLIFTVMAVNAQGEEETEEDDVLGVVVQQAASGEFDGETLTLNGVLPIASIMYYDDEDDLAVTQNSTVEMYNSWKTYGSIEGNEALELSIVIEVYDGENSYQAYLVVTVNADAEYTDDEGVFVYDVVEVSAVVNVLDEEDDKAELPASFSGTSVFIQIDEATYEAWQAGYTEYINTARPGGTTNTCTFIC